MMSSRSLLLVATAGLLGAGFVQAQPMLLGPGAPSYIESTPLPMPVPGAFPVEPYQHETYYAPDIDAIQPIQEYTVGMPIVLYDRVVYRDTRRIHPAAVPYLVEVPLPPPRRARGCVDCPPSCAIVKICVPPCQTPCVRVRRNGHKLRYDFGKYSVDVLVRRDGRVIVNYNS